MTNRRYLTYLLCVLLDHLAVRSQELVSPCPRIFQYEQKPNEPDRWYGTAKLVPDQDLTGVWFRIVLDAKSIQVGNWFGEVETRDNNLGYLIKNPNYKLKAGTPLEIKFYVRYDPSKPPPKLTSFRLNAVVKCPENGPVTEPPQGMNQLFTNKPDISDPLSISNQGGFSINAGPSESKPALQQNPDEDFFHGDFTELLKPSRPGTIDPMKNTIVNGAVCGTVVKQPRPLITHGQATQEGEFPWHAALYHSQGIDLTYICGASLISLQHLITVAHCVTRKKTQTMVNPDNLVVYVGKFYLRTWRSPGIQDRRVDKIIIHPKYNPQVFGNDIAVLKLTEPAQLTSYVRPVCLWQGSNQLELVVNQTGIVVGWGFDETGTVTEQLTKAHMPIVSQETCIYSFPDFYSRFTSSTTFCAGFKNGTSVCNGDSGGGLVLPKPNSDRNNPIWQIRGLVSISVAVHNKFRCDSSHYVVFTDVAKHLDFVKNAMKQ
ncbi:chymotrypsin-like elastase family member 2A [Anthonomus grandis grandis]|uniref:chymotrypsin-like elastase family member 2A n=1 Tax=Anthonomus grandis grandis TaxID=2921223 RepID=UPI002165A8C5|nr:chymotrypsin-like elastase family member 2A [Anthonomus grandis grandis]